MKRYVFHFERLTDIFRDDQIEMKRQFRCCFEVISVLGFPHFSPLTLQSQSLYLAVSFILWCVSMQIVR